MSQKEGYSDFDNIHPVLLNCFYARSMYFVFHSHNAGKIIIYFKLKTSHN